MNGMLTSIAADPKKNTRVGDDQTTRKLQGIQITNWGIILTQL